MATTGSGVDRFLTPATLATAVSTAILTAVAIPLSRDPLTAPTQPSPDLRLGLIQRTAEAASTVDDRGMPVHFDGTSGLLHSYRPDFIASEARAGLLQRMHCLDASIANPM